MAHRRIPDFFDPKSRQLTQSILSGKTPLVDVNRPGVSPNVLAFFQDPRNRAGITRPLAGGLDRVATQDGLGPAGSAARVKKGKGDIFAKRGVPHAQPGETQEEMAVRLQRSGKSRLSARDLSRRRFRLNEDLAQRRTDRDRRRTDPDARRRAAGRPTSEDREEQRQEAFRRVRERKGIFREDVNRRRRAQGRKPFGPTVQDEPIQIDSIDEVDPSVHGSGQDFETSDGEFFRFNNIRGVQSFTPLRQDPRTGQLVTDTRQIAINEFKDVLNDTEREVRRRLIAESGTLFARDLRGIQNNIAAIRASRQAGTTDRQTAEEQIEKLRDDEAELMFEFDKTIGFSTAFEAESDADIAREEAEAEAEAKRQEAVDDKAEARRTAITKVVETVLKDTDLKGTKFDAEVQRRVDLIDRLSAPEATVSPGQISPAPPQTKTGGRLGSTADLTMSLDPETRREVFTAPGGTPLPAIWWREIEGGDGGTYPFVESVQQLLDANLPVGSSFLAVAPDGVGLVLRHVTEEALARLRAGPIKAGLSSPLTLRGVTPTRHP